MLQRGKHVVEFMGYGKLLSPAPRPGQQGGVKLLWFEIGGAVLQLRSGPPWGYLMVGEKNWLIICSSQASTAVLPKSNGNHCVRDAVTSCWHNFYIMTHSYHNLENCHEG